jgi:hypothetical protein
MRFWVGKYIEQTLCDVCEQNAGDVCASGVARVSYVRCKICVKKGAEAIGVICCKIFDVEHPVFACAHKEPIRYANPDLVVCHSIKHTAYRLTSQCILSIEENECSSQLLEGFINGSMSGLSNWWRQYEAM